MAARPRQFWTLIAGFVVLILVGIATAFVVRGAAAQNELVTHTSEVRRQARSLVIALLDTETGQRGFLLTAHEPYAERYEIGRDQVMPSFERLRALTVDNARQQERLDALKPVLAAKLAEIDRTMVLARQGDPAGALDIVRTDEGKRMMDAIRRGLSRIDVEEGRLLEQRRRDSEDLANLVLLLTVAGLLAAALLGATAVSRLSADARDLEGANAAIRDLNEGLEATVAERTADLQLANDEIQRFAYIVSHDLRAPLVNIMGFTSELDTTRADLAESLPDDAKAQELDRDMAESIGFIRSSTGRMDRLIGSILKLSREGQRNLAPERLDLTEVIEGIGSNLAHQLDETGAELTVAELPKLTADRIAVEQVFANLIENAIKYRDPTRPLRIGITGRTTARDVVIAVADTARGIAAGDHGRVFDLFRRAGTQDTPGEGIGLATVRALVRRLGGMIALESTLGKGSTFTVTLPMVPMTGGEKEAR